MLFFFILYGWPAKIYHYLVSCFSDSSSDDGCEEGDDFLGDDSLRTKRGGSLPPETLPEDSDHLTAGPLSPDYQPTMWIGTEDGCIHIYNCNDNIRTRKNKIKLQHHVPVHSIL